jgi:hypothetical protein
MGLAWIVAAVAAAAYRDVRSSRKSSGTAVAVCHAVAEAAEAAAVACRRAVGVASAALAVA